MTSPRKVVPGRLFGGHHGQARVPPPDQPIAAGDSVILGRERYDGVVPKAEPVVQLKNVAKKFRIFQSPKDRLKEALDPFGRIYHKDFWALKDITLDFPKGRTVGIIGRNGSGKSTLLQIIAGILHPTRGRAVANGSLSALLELGTGFNPDFTGRQNVLLHGAITGQPSNEMASRIDFVEAFADIGEFFEMPVRMYSSGMFARLAFASAISVEPDILIVDEILAVGDARFLEKSFRHMQGMQKRGTTLILVSHDAELILRLCDSAVYLDAGDVKFVGEPRAAIARYHGDLFRDRSGPPTAIHTPTVQVPPVDALASIADALPEIVRPILAEGSALYRGMPCYNKNEELIENPGAAIEDFAVLADGTYNFVTLSGQEEIEIICKIRFDEDVHAPHLGIGLVAAEGFTLSGSNTFMQGARLPAVARGEVAIYRLKVGLNLNSGDYFLNFGLSKDSGSALSMVSVRRLAIHLHVVRQNACSGFFHMPFTFEVVEGA
jgi:ABC-type polysaccharide/polyol phosphate transport system ATPase subunit